jgi:cobalamin biosynthesis Mg chelatase CobN
MSSHKAPRHDTRDYCKARTLAEELDDKNLAATIAILRTMLAAYGDVLFSRHRKIDPEKLAAIYQTLAEREKKKKGLAGGPCC